jgi:2-hydroxy-3-keto-5-methylthiopentenyl-1-phosphate phosphatase
VVAIGSMLVDFDGTAAVHDVAQHLLIEFGDPSWLDLEDAEARGEIGGRECLQAQAALLDAPVERMLAFAQEHCTLDPTFPPFVRWLEAEGVPVTVVSDGFGFYIPPLLEAAGLGHVPVTTNAWSPDGREPLAWTSEHGECIGCGTCKMRAVLGARSRGPVAFVGEGSSDRYAALYADVVFAKDRLVGYATDDGVPFLPWTTFDDVRTQLERLDALPGPVDPARCPGWTTS